MATCWDCNEAMVIINRGEKAYYICEKCNPEHKIEECIDGCYYVCCDCGHEIPIGVKKDYECDWCTGIMCVECIEYGKNGSMFCSETCKEKMELKS